MNWRKEFNLREGELFATESRASGQLAGLATKRINQYHYNVANGDRRVFPVAVQGLDEYLKDPRTNTVDAYMYQWNDQLGREDSERLFYRLQQRQGITSTKKGVGIAETFTGELRHPLDRQSSTAFRKNVYMARNPTAFQQEQQEAIGIRFGNTTRTSEPFYADPDVDFSSSARKT